MPEQFDPYYHWLGIPPQEQPPNHYRLLSLQLYEPNEEVIQHAVDRAMAHIRTFQSGQRAAESQRLLNEISRARICLLNPEKKTKYDHDLRRSLEIARPPSKPAPVASPPTRAAASPPATVAPPPKTVHVDVEPRRVKKSGPWWWIGLSTVLAAAVVLGVLISPVLFPKDEKRPVGQTTQNREIIEGDDVAQTPPDDEKQQTPPGEQSTTSPVIVEPAQPSDIEPDSSTNQPAITPDPPVSTDQIDPNLVKVMQNASGFLANHAALCQSLSLEAFPALATRLRAGGYRPIRVRPYVADGQVLVAACWLRDQVSWQLIWNKTSTELETAALAMLTMGYQPVDVAGYHHNGETRFVAVYRRGAGETTSAELTIGLSPADSSQHYTRLLSLNYFPSTNQLFQDGRGTQRESRVWVKQDPAAPTKWGGFGRPLEDQRPLFQSTDAPLRPLDVALVSTDATGESRVLAYSLIVKEDHASAAVSDRSLPEHQAHAMELAERGYVPTGISVIQTDDGPVAVSVWRTLDSTTIANREPLVQMVGNRPYTSGIEPETTTPLPNPAPPTEPPSNAQESIVKLAVPSEEELDKAAKIVDLRYASISTQAKTPAAKTVLVKELLSDADQEDDATVRFAMWQRAREIAEQGGQVELAFEAIDQQNAQFDTDSLLLQTESMKKILTAAKRSTNRHWLIWQTFQLADQARIAERYDLALELTETAGNAARRSNENAMAKAAREQAKRIEYSEQLHDAAAAMQQVLSESSDDPAANVAQGRYLCFVRNDWASGTKHLSRSDDEALARIAAMDQAKPTTALEQMAVADGWMALADKEDSLTKNALWRRAAFWYATALPKLTGDARNRADELLDELGDKIATDGWGFAEELPWVEGPPGQLRQFKGHNSAVYALAVSSNGRWMVSGSRDGSVRSWDLATGEARAQIASPFRRVEDVAFTLRDRFVVGHGGTKELAVWDIRDGKLANRLPTGKLYISSAAASRNGELIAWGLRTTGTENVMVWDAVRRRGFRTLTSPAIVSALAFSPEARRLVTGDERNKVVCWDLTTGNQLFQGTGTYPIQQIAFSPNGRHIATLGLQDLRVWDLVRGTMAHRFDDRNYVTCMAFLADGNHLVTAGYQHEISVWNVTTGLKTQTTTIGDSTRTGYLRSIAVLPDPRAVVVADDDGDIFLWRIGDTSPAMKQLQL